MKYPPPSHAATVWLTGDILNVSLPSPLDAPSHVVRVEINIPALASAATRKELARDERKAIRGLWAIMNTFRERAIESGAHTIATAAAPTQYDLDAIMKAMAAGRVTKIAPKREATDDLTLEDLDL